MTTGKDISPIDEKRIKDVVEKNMPAEKKVEILKAEIDRLADYIIDHVPGEPSQSEGAVDTAIRLLKKTKPQTVDYLTRTLDKLAKLVNKEFVITPKRGETEIDMAIRGLTDSLEDKNDRIMRECKRSGEPYIVLRAKDNLSVGTLQFYMMRAVDEKCPDGFVESLKSKFSEFENWRASHRYRTRMPD